MRMSVMLWGGGGFGGRGEYDENFRQLSQIHKSVRTIKGVGPSVMLMK